MRAPAPPDTVHLTMPTGALPKPAAPTDLPSEDEDCGNETSPPPHPSQWLHLDLRVIVPQEAKPAGTGH